MKTTRNSMKNRSCLKAAACGLALFGLMVGCSEEKRDAGKEKGIVEQASDKVAHQAVEQITQPIDKARDSQALQNVQNQKLEDMAAQSGGEPPKN